jgi:hypothetical protein
MSEQPDAPESLNYDGDISQMDALGIHAYEIFLSLQRGGFTQRDALTLVGHLISSGFMEISTYKSYSGEPEGAEEFEEDGDFLTLEDPDEEDFF